MKNSILSNKKTSASFKKMIELELVKNSNSTTCGMIYQPKMPSALRKFSKIENDK